VLMFEAIRPSSVGRAGATLNDTLFRPSAR
jgi:hypothetical protein